MSRLAADTALVLVHANNPHGFAHQRRVNEDNIDLNRNFIDFDAEIPDSPGYAELHPALVPDAWDGPARDAADAAIADYKAREGLQPFSKSRRAASIRIRTVFSLAALVKLVPPHDRRVRPYTYVGGEAYSCGRFPYRSRATRIW